ncbi:phenylalanine--tRNA ligase beta subunit-related protein [Streptomyces sp. NPDC046887]|uniref:B3/B4 domain-containing protein n=1 Tax=Streptomyces sp. NPDC046887 TaxID=3155472 RepID=UPI0033D961F6
MRFRHTEAVWAEFPELAAGVLHTTVLHTTVPDTTVPDTGDPASAPSGAGSRVAAYTARATARLTGTTEAELPEIHAWRRAFARMGLRPTQYRCASESLLRRLRREGALPAIHPVVDLCNALSMAYAVPVAVLDADRIAGPLLEVRHARGDERYTTFGGAIEHPAPGEVVFADSAGQAHARRWTNRQSGHSAVSAHTRRIFVVTEAMHEGGAETVRELLAVIAAELAAHGAADPVTAVLTASAPEFAFDAPSGADGAPRPAEEHRPA